jgi:hypothetical protein
LNQLTGEDASSYGDVKEYLMNQLRLVPSYFVDEFNCITRNVGETFKTYMSRLSTLLRYYLQSRKVDDFDSLFQLLICNKVKTSLSENVLSHVLRSEVTLDTQWADVNKLADILDTYHANYDRFDNPKASVLGAVSNASRGGQYNMANKTFYPREKSVSSVSVANAAKPNAGKPGKQLQ